VFLGLGIVFLILIAALLLGDLDTTKSVVESIQERNWANRIFRETAEGVGLWSSIGAIFLLAAWFVQKAGKWGLLALIVLNSLALLAASKDTSKGIILVFPLSLSLLSLVLEEIRIVLDLRRARVSA
jgi:hypothetical protein